MSKTRVYTLTGLNLRVSPMLQQPGELLRSVNVTSDFYGAKVKRPGYGTSLAGIPGASLSNLFNWTRDDDTTFYNYTLDSNSGILYYSTQGTGAWTACGNGTFTTGAAAYLGHAVQNNIMIVGDGVTATRHSTDGTSFTNTSLAPINPYWAIYQNRAYSGGTGSVVTYSVTNDVTNWNITGTSDSSSFIIPGAGKINQLYTAADRLTFNKTSKTMFRWDGNSLLQVPTNKGLSWPKSLDVLEDTNFFLNNDGFYTYVGDLPHLISLPIRRQISNSLGKGISGTINAAVTHQYKYMASVGSVVDDLTMGTVTNCIEVYDYVNNWWENYDFADQPSSWLSYRDTASGSQKLIFASGSQVFNYGEPYTNDNGKPIQTILEGVLSFGAPESDTELKYMWAMFNPGVQAKVQIALGDTYTTAKKKWIDLGDCSDGIAELRFPAGSRGKLLFWRIYEASQNARFDFYGFTIESTTIDRT